MESMSARQRAGARSYGRDSSPLKEALSLPRPSLPKPSLDAYERPRLAIDLGIPLAPSFLDLDDDDVETVAYDSEDPLPALLAECGQASWSPSSRAPAVLATTTSEIRARDASFHTSPRFPDDLLPELQSEVESNLHQVEAETIKDSLAPSDPRLRLVRLRVGVSSHPPQSIPLPLVRPRRSRRRSLFAKLLLVTIAVVVVLVVLSEFSAAAGVPWLDPRPLFTKGLKLAKEKIPWERLPRLPKL